MGLGVSGLDIMINNFAASQSLKYTQSSVPSEDYGRLVNTISAIRALSQGLGLFLGPIVGGVLVYLIGFEWMFEILGTLFLLSAMLEMNEIRKETKAREQYR